MAVNESNTIQYTVTTTNTADGTTLYWKTTGNTTNADITGGNTGSITITNNRALLNVTISSDANTDGPKTLGITILTGSVNGTPVVNTASTILINDTSLTPNLGFTSVPSSIDEGSAGTFNVNSSLPNATTAYWTINNVTSTGADFSAVSGSFVITGGVGSFTITPSADASTEGAETFTVSLRQGSISGTIEATSSSITINDTSVSPQYALYTWGDNAYGLLGLNSANPRSSSPTQVGTLTNWSMVSAGRYRSGAVKSDGTLWMWGYNIVGNLSDGTEIDRSSPVQVGALTNWSKLNCNAFNTNINHAIKTDGTLWAWGNGNSNLGLNSMISRSSPVQVGSGTTWSEISSNFGTAAIKSDGTLWTWGNNANGQLGLNTQQASGLDKSSPTQVGTLSNWSKVATGYPGRTAAVKTDGTLWLWGSLTYGNPGNNLDTDERSSPVQVGALTNWSKIALGFNTTLAIKTDGTLWAWGHNQYGQLGNNQKAPGYPGTTGRVSSPVQIGTGTNWNNVAINMTFATGVFTIATKTDGTLWAWGSNDYGALGLGLPNGSLVSSPIQVGSSTNWSLPSVGFTNAGALLRVN
jgi:alpha-tubulin suppressor-like RCC1 family protein